MKEMNEGRGMMGKKIAYFSFSPISHRLDFRDSGATTLKVGRLTSASELEGLKTLFLRNSL